MVKVGDKNVIENFISLGIVQGSNFLIPILIMPFVISKIGADGWGEIATAQVVMSIFITIADYGFNLTATKDIALSKGDTVLISGIVARVLIVKFIISCILFAVLIVCLLSIPGLHSYIPLYLLSFISVIGQVFLISWLFQGIERMRFITYIVLFARLIFVLLVVLFIRSKADNIYFVFFTGVGNIIAGIVSIVMAVRLLGLRIVKPTYKDILDELKGGWHIMVSNLSVSSYLYGNVLILRLFTNDTVVGYYSVAEKIIMAARHVYGVYFQVIYQQVCQLAISSKHQLHRFLIRNYLWFLTSMFLGGFFLLFFANMAIGYFIKDEQGIAADYLRIMSFVPFLMCANIPAYQSLMAFNRKKVLLRIYLLGTALCLALNVLLTGMYGGYGSSITTLITEIVMTSCLIVTASGDKEVRLWKYVM